MSGVTTSWGGQDQNERMISYLAWVIVVIMIFYASVFVYKRAFAPSVAATVPPTPTPDAFPTPRAFPPTVAPSYAPPHATVRPTPVPTPVPSAAPTAVAAATAEPSPTEPEAPASTPPQRFVYTLKVGDFTSATEALERARSVRGLGPYSFEPAPDPATGRVSLLVGRFREARDAQVALAAIRSANPALKASVIPTAPTGGAATPAPTVAPTVAPPPAPSSTPRPRVTPAPVPTAVAVLPPPPSPTPAPTLASAPVTTPAPTATRAPRPGTNGRRTVRPTPRPTATAPALPTAGSGRDREPLPPPGYAVQAGSFQSRERAALFRRQLESQGYEAYVLLANRRGVDWFRVQVGAYPTSAEAEGVARKLEAAYREPCIIIKR